MSPPRALIRRLAVRQAERQQSERSTEGGQISILMIGMVAIVLMIVLSIVSVTSIQLSRIHLLDAADAAALDASDALAMEQAYAGGLGGGVLLSDETVGAAATDHLARRTLPERLQGWAIAPGTGSPDGRTATVVVTGTARVPILSPLLSAFGSGVTITVTSSARSDLDP
ncbi:pilus assembly protein TadG-related protein [Ornithinimicrobium sp. Y1847]|uniref:pilus assembly protein TadG-related protein n=1 Tax=unclassified Ornithinimicrobium TaxID=2615080 RepID=UPI003B67A31F